MTRMSLIFGLAVLNFLFIICNGNTCDRDTSKDDVSNFPISLGETAALRQDEKNVTSYLGEFIANLRYTLNNENLPPDLVDYLFFDLEHRKNPIHFNRTKCSFKNVPYNKRKPLLFVIHGYTTEPGLIDDRRLMGDLIYEMLKLDKYNVIAVDYSVLNADLPSAVLPKVFLAAKEMARTLKFIMSQTGLSASQIHVLGVSLGAQVSGLLGNWIPGLGRISGLDPGGSFFVNLPEDLRLNRGDANFVDVIHTNALNPITAGWGFYPPLGDLDFYVNGGLFQPGCESTQPINEIPTTDKEASSRLCMHGRMVPLFIESMCGRGCQFIGVECDSYEKYQNGLCTPFNSRTALMGQFATKPLVPFPKNAMLFLNTNGHYPYCKNQQPGFYIERHYHIFNF